jgi:hypothetical protein
MAKAKTFKVTAKLGPNKMAFFEGRRHKNGAVLQVTEDQFSEIWMVRGEKSGEALEKAKVARIDTVSVSNAAYTEVQQKLV